MKNVLIKIFKYLTNNWDINKYVEKIDKDHPNNIWPDYWYIGDHKRTYHIDFYEELKRRDLD